MKYITSIGQNTGISNMLKKDATNDAAVALEALIQNLNSGRRLMKGLNSSSDASAASSKFDDLSSCSKDGSNFGVRKERNKLKRYIPKA